MDMSRVKRSILDKGTLCYCKFKISQIALDGKNRKIIKTPF